MKRNRAEIVALVEPLYVLSLDFVSSRQWFQNALIFGLPTMKLIVCLKRMKFWLWSVSSWTDISPSKVRILPGPLLCAQAVTLSLTARSGTILATLLHASFVSLQTCVPSWVSVWDHSQVHASYQGISSWTSRGLVLTKNLPSDPGLAFLRPHLRRRN